VPAETGRPDAGDPMRGGAASMHVGKVPSTPPKWYVVAAWLGLAWNALGLLAFFAQWFTNPASLPEAERAFAEATPGWATAAFAVATACGVSGSIGLVLRRRFAAPVLMLSLAGVIVQNLHALVLANGLDVFGAAALALPVLVIVIGIALIWLARRAASAGWMRSA